ncbi:hypothetical protein ACFW1A_27885 [Kitasatospora sp. NPDC058965]|uniref:hypothetical protein n=1 Tax=Kitasatospora sp. NPDC058965 TaxID=3346682 RepID=UPI0036B0C6C2
MGGWRFARSAVAHGSGPGDSGRAVAVVADRHWSGAARSAAVGAVLLPAAALLLDWGSGELTLLRAAVWLLLGGAVYAVARPARVVVGEGRLEVRGLVGRRVVHTDALVTARVSGSIAVHLILHDVHGHWAEVDLRVLAANPLLWHRLESDARRAQERGTLRSGADVLAELGARLSGEQARAVFRSSGL